MNHMKKISGIILIISIVVVLSIPLILSYSIKDFTVWGILVTYAGTIVGGLLTLLGVIYSIKHSQREKTKELELLYRPLLKVEEGESSHPEKELMITCNNENYDDSNLIYGKKCLIIKNIGRGEMQEVRIRNIKVDSVAGVIPYAEGNLLNSEEIDLIGVEDSIAITIGTPKNKVKDDISTIYNVTFIVEYYGILNKSLFQNRVQFCISMNNKGKTEIYNIKSSTL